MTLVTDHKEYKLRRRGGNPFFDEELERLVGKTIRCNGFVHDYTFIMAKFEELETGEHLPGKPEAESKKRRTRSIKKKKPSP